jgi:hypothetical protein
MISGAVHPAYAMRRSAETMCAVVSHPTVITEHRLQPGLDAPVGELVAERGRRRERPPVVVHQERQPVTGRHRVERCLQFRHDPDRQDLPCRSPRLVWSPAEAAVANVLPPQAVRIADVRNSIGSFSATRSRRWGVPYEIGPVAPQGAPIGSASPYRRQSACA